MNELYWKTISPVIRAEQETPVPLLETVEWETIKTWFRQQAREIGQGWLE